MWGHANKLSRMVAERDEWLLHREARISSLEKIISELEQTVRYREATIRDREEAANNEVSYRDARLREKDERIVWLENQVRRLETPRVVPRTYDLGTRLKDLMSRLPGWCPEQKAVWMADQIRERGYKVGAEIGVYAGRSLFPIALAVAANGGGAVYAVDAWDNLAATSEPTNLRNDLWWDDADLGVIKRQFLNEIILQNLADTIKILEMPSQEAFPAIAQRVGRTIDFLHIDGAHSEFQAVFDTSHWSELVAPGGTIVLDDIDWIGVREAADFLQSRFDTVGEFRGEKFAYAAYRVPQ